MPLLLILAGLLLLVIPTGTASAQTERLRFEHITIEQGLSHNFTMAVMQDRKGYLWFGTGNGLNKYDGYRFTHYKYNPQDSNTLPKNQVFLMWEDKNGIIWIGTSEGTCKFDPRSEQFTRLERSASNPYAFKYAQSFNEDEEGNLWVAGSFEGDLRRIDKKAGKFSATNYADLLRAPANNNVKSNSNLHITFQDRSGALWVGSPFGLHRLTLTARGKDKPADVDFTHYRHDPADSNSISRSGVAGIYEDRKGILWVMTLEGILNAFDSQTEKFTRYRPDPARPLRIYEHLRAGITEDLAGNLWIGTFNGLYKLDQERKTFTSFFHDPTDPESLINNAIFALHLDQSGILWVATMGGVDKVDTNRKPFGLYRHNPSNPHSLSHNSIAAICEDKGGTVWVGTRGGGLNALDKTTRKFTHYRYDPKDITSLRSDTVGAILEDQKGNLWIGNGEALSLFNPTKKNFTHYSLHHPFLWHQAAPPIHTLYEDREGIFWLGTNNGILRFDPETTKTVSYPYDPNNPKGITDYWALAILEGRRGNLWIGPGSQALMRFDRKKGTFTHYTHDGQNSGSISSNTVPAIYEDTKGNLWFGTGEGGLCRYDQNTEKFTCYTEKQGLAGNSVFSILEDAAGNLWLGTNNGLSKFDPVGKTFTNYGTDDGLQSKLFVAIYTEAAAFKGNDGTLYFGGNNGFNAFHPTHIRTNTYVPPVVITAFKLFDKPLPGKQEANQIELPYNQNFFSLEFAALNYTSTQKNQYAYQLEGVDKDWVLAGTRRTASYTNIGPGRYRFKVKGSNNDGVWNPKPATLTIVIHPPFWQTPWAYTLYGLLFGVALLLARREVVRRERLKADLKIEQVASEKLRELDTAKSHFFANISHEFRTPLSLIRGTVEKLEKQHPVPARPDDYQLINRNAGRLLELINQLLDLSKLEAGKLALHPEKGELTGFLSLAAASFASLYEGKKIDYAYHLPQSPRWALFDADKLEKILSNLLANAYKFTPAGGKVVFSAALNEEAPGGGTLRLQMQDTGIGIPAAQLPRIFDRFHQADTSATRPYEGTGIGLTLVKELIDLHGGTITVESSEGKGTTVSVQLPLALTLPPVSHPDQPLPEKAFSPAVSLPAPQPDATMPARRKSPEHALQVLVVEDNAELRHFIGQHLFGAYAVLEAENGLAGYEKAVQAIPDVIISDLMMPGLDGLSLCEKLKTDERTSHIPLILLTAKADIESRLQGLSTGADDYLTKPFHLEELQLRVRNLLESQKRMQERLGKQLHLNPEEIPVSSPDERFLNRVRSIMEAHLANADFDVEVFSREIGLSRTHLHRKLTALTGQAPNEFVRTFRLKRAARLLKQQHGNVSEIAYAVGFNTINYFTKCFKDFYGVTPTEYARKGAPSQVDNV